MIATEQKYRTMCQKMDVIIAKGTQLGDMELLPNEDKTEYIRLSTMIREWERVHYSFPIAPNPLIAQIQEQMTILNLKQRDAAKRLEIDESRMSEIMRGKRAISMKLAKKIYTELNISAEMLIEYA